ncbi:hypothetical protein FRC14_004383 [Serendipita sp. 396]|nr:hypothetical protein FRC14_004383 [Serendipita sp. 396]
MSTHDDIPSPHAKELRYKTFLIDSETAVRSPATNITPEAKAVKPDESDHMLSTGAGLDDGSPSRILGSMSTTPNMRKSRALSYREGVEACLLRPPDCHSTPPTCRNTTAMRNLMRSSPSRTSLRNSAILSNFGNSFWGPQLSPPVITDVTFQSGGFEFDLENWFGGNSNSPLPCMAPTPSTPFFLPPDDLGTKKLNGTRDQGKSTNIDAMHEDIEHSYAEFLKMVADGLFDEPSESFGDKYSKYVRKSMIAVPASCIDDFLASHPGTLLQWPDPVTRVHSSDAILIHTRLISLIVRNLADVAEDSPAEDSLLGTHGFEQTPTRPSRVLQFMPGRGSIATQEHSNEQLGKFTAPASIQSPIAKDTPCTSNKRESSTRYRSMVLSRSARQVLLARRRRMMHLDVEPSVLMTDAGDADVSRFSDSTFMSSMSDSSYKSGRSNQSLSLDLIRTVFEQNSAELAENSSSPTSD